MCEVTVDGFQAWESCLGGLILRDRVIHRVLISHHLIGPATFSELGGFDIAEIRL